MFMQSFENSDRQQRRLKSRQLAMRRMERAAGMVAGSPGSRGDPEPAASADDANPKPAAGDGFGFEPAEKSLRKANPADPPPDNGNEAANGTCGTLGAHAAPSVTAASDFLRETQRQHQHARQKSSSRSARSSGSPPASPQFSVASRMTLSKLKGKLESSTARQFLWDESSLASGRSNAVNLHDIKNSLREGGGKTRERNERKEGKGAWTAIDGDGEGEGAAKKGADFWSVLPPLWRGGRPSPDVADSHSVGSSKYRDREGERLLNLASERLNAGPGTGVAQASLGGADGRGGLFVENMEVLQEEDREYIGEVSEGDSLTGGQGQKRVFLDTDGSLSYNNQRYSLGDEDYSRRRLMNQFRRSFKKPCIIGIVVVAIVGIVYGAHGLYSKRLDGIFEGPGYSDGAWSGELADDDGWAESWPAKEAESWPAKEGGVAVKTQGEATEEEQMAAAEVAANIESSPGGGWNKEKLPLQVEVNVEAASKGGSALAKAEGPFRGEELPPQYKERFDHLRYTLVNQAASPPEVFLDTRSAQYAALVWLAKDDPRHMDPESVYLKQRYGLAALWFATTKGGYQWHVPEKPVVRDRYGEEEGADEKDYYYEEEEGGESDEADGWFDDDDGDDGIDHYAEYEDPDEWPQRRLRRRKLLDKDDAAWFRRHKWLSADGVCGWEGVSCRPRENGNARDGDDDGDVESLELRRNNLRGLIPEEMHRTLPYLTVLDLSDNGLAGTLSDEVGSMKKLGTLNLTLNNIAGSLPSSIGELASLRELHAAGNLLGDTIPHAIRALSNLRRLDLSGNTLKGTIPYEVGKLTQLSSLDLSHNFLVGPLPHEVSELKALVSLDVSHNDLGGPMIAELSQVNHLEMLRLNDNHFSGELPAEVGSLVHLEELHLSNNDFRGTLPGEISNLGGLDVLHVANNHFHGGFPPEWTSMAGMRDLDVSSNELTGEIPIFVDGMKNLRSLNLARNDFSSTIPSELGRLYKLEYLYLDGNEFTGGVPGEFGELTDLRGMALHNNYLTGWVDDRVCRLADELFLAQLSVDCGGEMPDLFCDCCLCHDREPIVHLTGEP